MKLSFACPECERPARVDLTGPVEWQCPWCDHLLRLNDSDPGHAPSQCLVCGTREIYKKKDFPHALGLAILTVACLGSVIPYYLYHQWLTWTILIGSALLDAGLYLWVGDVLVCYRCHAHYRGVASAEEHKPFELGIAERYRQEEIRRQQIQDHKRKASPTVPGSKL